MSSESKEACADAKSVFLSVQQWHSMQQYCQKKSRMILIHSQHMFDEHFYNKIKESSTSNWIPSYKSVAFIFRPQFWTKCFLSVCKIQTDWMHVISRRKSYEP